jgi:hypothetical protein
VGSYADIAVALEISTCTARVKVHRARMKVTRDIISVFAISRLFTDTTWTSSPRVFVADTILAAISWTVFALALRYQRRKALRT